METMENSKPQNSQSNLKSKMKILQIVQKNFETVGVHPNLKSHPYPLNGKILMGIFILGMGVVCNFQYTFHEAKTFSESVQSMYIGSMVFLILFILMRFILNVNDLFEFIDDCESMANTGEAKTVLIKYFANIHDVENEKNSSLEIFIIGNHLWGSYSIRAEI